MKDSLKKKPLVYSCSGCSSAAQMANYLAIKLTRNQLAEMSCIAGVGGGVKPLVRVARSGRPILAIDGCQLRCTSACLANVGVKPHTEVNLAEWGVKKTPHEDFSMEEAEVAYSRLAEILSRSDD